MKVSPGYLLLSVFLLLFCQTPVAQVITDPQELFSEGEFFYLAEEYEEALYFYLQLLELYRYM